MVQGEASSVTSPAAASSASRAAAYGMIKPRHGVMITGPLPVISHDGRQLCGGQQSQRHGDTGVITNRPERHTRWSVIG